MKSINQDQIKEEKKEGINQENKPNITLKIMKCFKLKANIHLEETPNNNNTMIWEEKPFNILQEIIWWKNPMVMMMDKTNSPRRNSMNMTKNIFQKMEDIPIDRINDFSFKFYVIFIQLLTKRISYKFYRFKIVLYRLMT